MKNLLSFLILCGLLTQPLKAQTDSLRTKSTVGIAIDLLPPVLSALTHNLGYSCQLWYGYDKVRFRGVVAGFQMPDKLMGNEDFKDLKITAYAVIVDYFIKNDFKGFWAGAGFEIWDNNITAEINSTNYNWNNYVATMGCGYIYNFYGNFYVEPWGAIHGLLNEKNITIASSVYKPGRIQAEVSLKLGWHF